MRLSAAQVYGHDNLLIVIIHYRIEFLKATGGKLMQPNVRDIHEWTGEKVKQIAGQGDIYIRTTYPLQLEIVSFGRGVGEVLLS